MTPAWPDACQMDPYTPTCGESYYDYAGRNVYQVHSQEAVCLGAGVREAGGAAPSGLSDRECVSPQRDAYLRVIEEDAGEEKCSESTLWIEPQSPLRVEIYPQDLNCELSGEPLVAVSVSVPT